MKRITLNTIFYSLVVTAVAIVIATPCVFYGNKTVGSIFTWIAAISLFVTITLFILYAVLEKIHRHKLIKKLKDNGNRN